MHFACEKAGGFWVDVAKGNLGAIVERRLKDDVGSALDNDILGEADIDRPFSVELPAQT